MRETNRAVAEEEQRKDEQRRRSEAADEKKKRRKELEATRSQRKLQKIEDERIRREQARIVPPGARRSSRLSQQI